MGDGVESFDEVPIGKTLETIFTSSSSSFSDRIAIITPENDKEYTYKELWELSLSIRECLIKVSDQVPAAIAILATNGIDFVASFLAIVSGGFAAAPINPISTREELEFLFKDAQVSTLIVSTECFRSELLTMNIPIIKVTMEKAMVEIVNNVPQQSTTCASQQSTICAPQQSTICAPPGTSLLLHTSGTTAKPKLVPISGVSLVNSAKNLADAYNLTKEDKLLLVMPLFHVHGLIGNLLTSFISGGTVILPKKFSAHAYLKLAQRYAVTWLSAVPTMYQILFENKKEYLQNVEQVREKLCFIRSCSAAMTRTLLNNLQELFKVPIIQAYGMTETAHLTATGKVSDPNIPFGSVGMPVGRELKILPETNEICVKGFGVLCKYLKPESANSTAFTKDGYFRTGDYGSIDENGYLFIQGRIKEIINRGGEKIDPYEIESVIINCEDKLVKEVVCFALPDKIYGECVACIIVPFDEAISTDIIIEKISLLCKSRLSLFKCPSVIIPVTEVPKSSIGKVQRSHLAKIYSSN